VFHLFRCVSHKQLALRGGDITAAMEAEDLELHRVIIEPASVLAGEFEDTRGLGIWRAFFDNEWRVHVSMVIGAIKLSQQIGVA
jgi:hypothetical protein